MSFLFFFNYFFLLEAPYFNIGDNSFWWKFEARGSMTVVLKNKICNKMKQLICAYILHTGSDSVMINIYKSEAVMALNIEIPSGM
jgi:hypothetical protein